MEKILIINDDVNTCNAYKALLQTEEFTVFSTQQGENVFTILNTHNIKIIIIDIPENNEADLILAEKIKKEFSHSYIFMLRADSSPAIMKNIFDIGIEDCFVKPFLPLRLTNAIKKTMPKIHMLDGINALEKELSKNRKTLHELKSNMAHHPITGIFQTNFFHKCFDHEVKRAKRNDHWLSLLLVACTKKKHLGEPISEDLVKTATIIKNKIRESDILAHYNSGFAIILPETPEDGCSQLSNRFKKNIDPEHNLKFGSSTYPTDSLNAERLIKVANSRLSLR